jgi:hypothetical protein
MSPALQTTDAPMTRAEAAKYLRLSPITLTCWAARGTGPRYCRSGKTRGRVVYRRADLDAWLESHSVSPSSGVAAADAGGQGGSDLTAQKVGEPRS